MKRVKLTGTLERASVDLRSTRQRVVRGIPPHLFRAGQIVTLRGAGPMWSGDDERWKVQSVDGDLLQFSELPLVPVQISVYAYEMPDGSLVAEAEQ